MSELWEVDESKTHEAWLELREPAHDGIDGEYIAGVRFDGCVHLHGSTNGSFDEPEGMYFHICDIDDMIARLQAIKAWAQAHFGTWPR